jgi:CxxC motif-containing protein (DUF1111 family)
MARPSRALRRALLAGLALAVALGLGLRQVWGAADPRQAAGAMTVANRTSASFEQPAAGLTPPELERHQVADGLFDRTHVPLEGPPGAGLGPRFNAASCIACHVRNGRGRPLMGESLVRVALRNGRPVPGLGHQVRDRAVLGARPDAAVTVTWLERDGLRRPEVQLEGGASLELSDRSVARSLRVAPPLIGLGLLEAVPEEAILAHADPDDRDGDGISGRPHWLQEPGGKWRLGRFGWKAISPSLKEQTAAALLNDMGLTSPGDIGRRELELVTYYSQTLGAPRTALPASRPVVRRGRELFDTLECARCHVPQLATGRSPAAVAGVINGQTIWPYTDLLLHDMGAGLDDGVAEKGAPGREWRTAPLWGLGLAQRVNGSVGFLHDGRARSIEEAIRWHGGEAAAARERFTALGPQQRRQLLGWLRQL